MPSVCHQVHYLVRQLPDPVWHRHQDEEPVDRDWEGDEEGGVERTDGWIGTHGGKNCWYRPKFFRFDLYLSFVPLLLIYGPAQLSIDLQISMFCFQQ